MDNLKRVGIFLLIAAVLVVVSVGYQGSDIKKRAIVLGLGIDSSAEGILLTAEIVNPGNGTEQVGTFAKIVSATGRTVVEALQNIAEKTGKETSMGQCVLLCFGEEFVASDFSDTVEYFAMSDSVRENVAVCCAKGTAKQLFENCDALEQSVSLSVSDKLNGQFEDISLPTCDLLTYYRSQKELYRTGFLNYVYFEQTSNTDEQNPDKPQVYFCCDQVMVLKQNAAVGLLSAEETQGFALLKEKVLGTLLPVTEEDSSVITLRVGSKQINTDAEENKISIKLNLSVKLARADSFGSSGKLIAKSQKNISQSALEQCKRQAAESAQKFLRKQTEWDFDLLRIHEMFRQKYGSTQYVLTFKMNEMPFELYVSATEE